MFFIINFDGSPQSTSQDKGKLFELLVRDIVDNLGYQDIELRAKIAGKEYDIRAKSKLRGRVLIGQAKAWENIIRAKEITEFIGSLESNKIPDDAEGLFVSLTDFTPEAREFLSDLKKDKRERVLTIVGDQIFDYLEKAGYASRNEVKRRAKSHFQNNPGDTHLLISNRGNFFIQLLVRHGETRPKAFCVLSKDGEFISEADFGKQLQHNIEELRELAFLTHRGDFTSILDTSLGIVGPGPEGANWFEYKLPAPSQYFIGRDVQIENFQNFLNEVKTNRVNLRIYQVLSPSGVGKTSIMRKMQSLLDQPSCFEDARNFRSSLDLLALMQEFLSSCKNTFQLEMSVPTDTAAVLNQFSKIGDELRVRNQVGVIFVDQFESLFLKPDLYAYFLDLVVRITHDAKNIIFCIARRNDQPTTFDDRVGLDLQRLTGMSQIIELKDFSRVEVLTLLSHLSDEIGQNIKPQLLNAALEFVPSGYPWLCKRVGAHIRDALIKKKLTQEELIQSGISPEELFDEDLAELDIINREFLKELAKYLPATLDDLSQKFDGKSLAVKLKMLHDMRLIRLIGRTYDTYNDLFKEYLKTGELPLLTKYVFRGAPSTTKKVLEIIITHNCRNVKDVAELSEKHLKLNYKTIQNVLRELRMLELVETLRGQLEIDPEMLDAFQKGNLDVLIKDRVLRRNNLVRDVLKRLAAQDQITLKQLMEYLKEGLPVLEVSEESWHEYALIFARWLRVFGLIRSKQIIDERKSKAYSATLDEGEMFLPNGYMNGLIETMEGFKSNELRRRFDIGYPQALDCERIGLLEPDETRDFLKLTALGKTFISNIAARPKIIRDFLLSLSYVSNYLERIEASRRRHMDVFKLVVGDVGFTDKTWNYRGKILANWLEFAGLVIRKSGWIQVQHQYSLFE